MDNVFMFIELAGGLALFLYGMTMLGAGLEKLSGGRMERTLEKLTKNIFLSVLLGATVTAAIQSSSATTVIVVGLVNAGLLKLRSAVGVIMGANIGTTVTAQILRLGDLEGNANVALQFLKPTTLAPIISIVGIVMFMVCKTAKIKNLGQILLGFGILFNGMFGMEAAVKPLSESPAFGQIFTALSNPILGVLAGAIVTAIIQSSSASIGILQALSSTGAITFSAAFPIIMGQNIGTCITPILASIGANKNAKRSAAVHLSFNVIGTAIFLIVVYSIKGMLPFWNDTVDKGMIANFHTIFNVVVTLLLMPFAGLLAKLAELIIRDKKQTAGGEEEFELDNTAISELDDRLLRSPSLALGHCKAVVADMGRLSQANFKKTVTLFGKYDAKRVERIREREDAIDRMEDRVNNYLLKLTDCELDEAESKQVTHLLRVVSEFERVGDYSINLVECAEMLREKEAVFSEKAVRELEAITDAVQEIIGMSLEAFEKEDVMLCKRIEPLEEVIDTMEDTLKFRHIQRLKNGKCTVDAGIVFLDALTNIERISDHCSNIAVYIIGTNNGRESLNRHDYIKKMHQGETADYQEFSKLYQEQYFSRIES